MRRTITELVFLPCTARVAIPATGGLACGGLGNPDTVRGLARFSTALYDDMTCEAEKRPPNFGLLVDALTYAGAFTGRGIPVMDRFADRGAVASNGLVGTPFVRTALGGPAAGCKGGVGC